ncbi:MAG: hypothetical protein M1815_003480, partial [Lichina confinis]
MSDFTGDANFERDGLQPPRGGPGGRSMSTSNATIIPTTTRGLSFATPGPGSFMPPGASAESIGGAERQPILPLARSANVRPDFAFTRIGSATRGEERSKTEQRMAELKDKLNKEMKIRAGSENLLEALNIKKAKQSRDQVTRVESELNSINRKISQLRAEIEELENVKEPEPSTKSRISALFNARLLRSASSNANSVENGSDAATEMESPTFALAELLQSLDVEGMQPDYYVERANRLVSLFKRHPTLKYDLAWPVFGLRMQTLLLSDSREVVAAGYRVTRHAIADRKSLQTIRSLNTDYLVILSLVKESKASIEREQALKFVRAFLDVKEGVEEISRAVVRTIVAVAEHPDDRLRNISIETLAEILIRNPALVVSAGGIGPLTDALADGTYEGPESLAAAFLYLLDTPRGRKYLRAGQGLE